MKQKLFLEQDEYTRKRKIIQIAHTKWHTLGEKEEFSSFQVELFCEDDLFERKTKLWSLIGGMFIFEEFIVKKEPKENHVERFSVRKYYKMCNFQRHLLFMPLDDQSQSKVGIRLCLFIFSTNTVQSKSRHTLAKRGAYGSKIQMHMFEFISGEISPISFSPRTSFKRQIFWSNATFLMVVLSEWPTLGQLSKRLLGIELCSFQTVFRTSPHIAGCRRRSFRSSEIIRILSINHTVTGCLCRWPIKNKGHFMLMQLVLWRQLKCVDFESATAPRQLFSNSAMLLRSCKIKSTIKKMFSHNIQQLHNNN